MGLGVVVSGARWWSLWKTRPGDPYLKGALGVAAMSIARHTTTSGYLGAKYRRVATRRGPMKAIVAVEHAIGVHPSGVNPNVTLTPRQPALAQ